MGNGINSLVLLDTLTFWEEYKSINYIAQQDTALYKIVFYINKIMSREDYIVLGFEKSNTQEGYLQFSLVLKEIAKISNIKCIEVDDMSTYLISVAKRYKKNYYAVEIYTNHPEAPQIITKQGDKVNGIGIRADVKDWDNDSVRYIVPGVSIYTGYGLLVSILLGNKNYNLEKLGVQQSLITQLLQLISKVKPAEPTTIEGLEVLIKYMKELYPPEYDVIYPELRERFNKIAIPKCTDDNEVFTRGDYVKFIGIMKYMKLNLDKVISKRALAMSLEDVPEITLNSYYSKTGVFI